MVSQPSYLGKLAACERLSPSVMGAERPYLKTQMWPHVMAHTFNPAIQEADIGGSL